MRALIILVHLLIVSPIKQLLFSRKSRWFTFLGICVLLMYLFNVPPFRSPMSSLYSLVPKHSPLVVDWSKEDGEWSSFQSDSSSWFFQSFGDINNWLHEMDSSISYQQFLSSLVLCGASDLQWIHLYDMKKDENLKKLVRSEEVRKTTYKGKQINMFLRKEGTRLFFMKWDGIWLFSNKSIALELLIEALEEEDATLIYDQAFERCHGYNQKGVNVFIQPSKCNQIIRLLHPDLLSIEETEGPDWIHVSCTFSTDRSELLLHVHQDASESNLKQIDQFSYASLITNDIVGFHHKKIEPTFQNSFFKQGILLHRQPLNEAFFYESDRLAVLTIENKESYQEQFLARSVTGRYLNFDMHYLEDTTTLYGAPEQLRVTCWVEIEGHALFSSTERGLKKWIDQYMTGQVIQNDSSAINDCMIDNTFQLPSLYVDLNRMQAYIEKLLTSRLDVAIRSYDEFISTWSHIVLHAKNESGNELVGRILKQKSDTSAEVSTAWSFYAGADIIYGPSLARQEQNGVSNDLFIQDKSGYVYGLNNRGQEIFDTTLHFNEPLIGSVYQIDFFGTGIPYFLMTTTSEMHIVSTTGQVEKSLKFVAKTTSGVLILRVENEPFLFVACENGYVYAYDLSLGPLGAWARNQVGHSPIQLFASDDLIEKGLVCVSGDGVVHQFSLDGQRKARYDLGADSIYSVAFDPTIDRLVAHVRGGKLIVMNRQGKSFTLSYPSFDESNSCVFLYEDCFSDHRKDFIRLINNEQILCQYYQKNNGTDAFKADLRSQIPTIHSLDAMGTTDPYWSFVGFDTIENKVYFFNQSLQLHSQNAIAGVRQVALLPFDSPSPKSTTSLNMIVTRYGNKLTSFLFEGI